MGVWGNGPSFPESVGEKQMGRAESKHPQRVSDRCFQCCGNGGSGDLHLFSRALSVALASLACLAPLDFLE